jgi:hypothetical protein
MERPNVFASYYKIIRDRTKYDFTKSEIVWMSLMAESSGRFPSRNVRNELILFVWEILS